MNFQANTRKRSQSALLLAEDQDVSIKESQNCKESSRAGEGNDRKRLKWSSTLVDSHAGFTSDGSQTDDWVDIDDVLLSPSDTVPFEIDLTLDEPSVELKSAGNPEEPSSTKSSKQAGQAYTPPSKSIINSSKKIFDILI